MSQPNIILICADQWRGDCLGWYKNQHPVMTPHLNQLIREGTIFTQAYADCPICMPQRATMLTGLTGTEMGCLNNFNESNAPKIDPQQTLPGRCSREKGYHSTAVGKMHFAPARARFGYENVRLHPDDYVNWLENTPYAGQYRGHGLGGNEIYPTVATTPDSHYHSTWIINEAIDFLHRKDPSSPFLLNVTFEAPHSPFDPPMPFDRMYEHFDIADPIAAEWSGTSGPLEFQRQRIVKNTDDLNPALIRESRRRYYGQMSHIDFHLGRLFGTLKTLGLDDNTWIVFTSDHGEFLGDHGMWAKHNFLQAAGRIPLIVRGPRGFTHTQSQCNTPVLTADIVPTLLEAAGLEIEMTSNQQAQSLIHLMTKPDAQSERVIIGETPNSVMAMNKNFKWIRFLEEGREVLFDLQNDINDQAPMDHPVAKELASKAESYLRRHNSAAVDQQGWIVKQQKNVDPQQLGRQNPWACRGNLRYGMGY